MLVFMMHESIVSDNKEVVHLNCVTYSFVQQFTAYCTFAAAFVKKFFNENIQYIITLFIKTACTTLQCIAV